MIIAVAASVVLGVAVAVIASSGGLENPRKVPLPDLAPTGDVAAYLKGDGTPIVQFVTATEELLRGEAAPRRCRAIADAKLVPLGEPSALTDLAAGIPDRGTADAAIAHVAAAMDFIAVCIGGDGPDAEELRFTRVVLIRQLAHAGVQA